MKKLSFNKVLFLDGAMGTMLQVFGLKSGDIPEVFNVTHPEILFNIHKQYVEAGSDIITTNTFGANEYKYRSTQYSLEEVITKAVEIARKAAGDRFVALDIGPTGHLLEPIGDLSFEDAYKAFARVVKIGASAGADLVLIETMSDTYEAKAAILAAKENCKLPVFCTMTFQENGRTLTGTDPETMVNIIQGLGVDALGVNCSVGPKDMMDIIEKILAFSKVPVIVQPNAGLPRLSNGNTTYDVTPEEFSKYMRNIAEKGAAVLGGCCGTKPEYIKEVRKVLGEFNTARPKVQQFTAVSSSRKTVVLGNEITIIGERINPTGKANLEEALLNKDFDYIVNEAMEQKMAGAHILDVNIGHEKIDEVKVMTEVISELQIMIDCPLQIDSTNAEVIEAAVRMYNGKPIINSVNGSEKSLNTILPIAKKYGACVIGLTFDEKGIPQTAEERVQIAEKIIDKALEYGIPKEDIIIDCLVLTASAEQSQVMDALKALRKVKEEFKVATTLGISNVSFGLPNRSLLNRTFLAMALEAGLDAPILDPTDEEMLKVIRAFNVLSNLDERAEKYIEEFEN
jgi:5-methyltetrahydrofolate--homocysteine methyltransferase